MKETVTEGNCPWRLMSSGPVVSEARLIVLERNLAAGGALEIEGSQVGGILLKLRFDPQDNPILVQLGKDGRDDPLAESIVEGIVDELRLDAEAGSRAAVDVHGQPQPLVLLIAADLLKLGTFSQGLDQLGGPGVQLDRHPGLPWYTETGCG